MSDADGEPSRSRSHGRSRHRRHAERQGQLRYAGRSHRGEHARPSGRNGRLGPAVARANQALADAVRPLFVPAVILSRCLLTPGIF